MRKVSLYLAGGAVAAIAALAAAPPANALLIPDGSFTFATYSGSSTVDTGNITLATSSVTQPSLYVQAVDGNLVGEITPNNVSAVGDPVTVTNGLTSALPVPPGSDEAGTAVPTSVNFTVTVGNVGSFTSLVFTFTTATTQTRDALSLIPASHSSGGFEVQYDGILSFGDGVFDPTNTSATLVTSCDEPAVKAGPTYKAGLINCSNTLVVLGQAGPPGPVIGTPEPASLTLLGASLLGFGLLWRRRTL